MFRLALRTLRFRKGGFIASFVGLFFGAVIVMACGGLMETGVRTAVPPQRLAAATVVVTGDRSNPEAARLDAGVTVRIQAVPGVAQAVPDVSFPAAMLRDGQAVTDGSQQSGHPWVSAALAPYRLVEGRAPAAPGEVVVDTATAARAGTKVGDQAEFAVQGHAQPFRVVGTAAADSVSASAVFFSPADASRFALRPDKIDSVGVSTAPGADVDQVRMAISGALQGTSAVVLTGDDRGLAEFSDVSASSETLIVLAAVFGGLALMVAIFVVASILGLSVQQRQRELALLRAIGTTPGQLRRMILGETAVIAVLATALAYPFNLAVGQFLLDQLQSNGVVSSAIVFHQGWVPTAVATAVALLAAAAAAFIAGGGAARTRPTEALAESGLQRRWLSWPRALLAVLCLGGGLALTLVTALVMQGPVAASTAGPTAMLWAMGLALISPGLTRILTALLRWPLRAFTGLAGALALENVSARRVRVAGAITPIMLVTGLATALIYLQTAQAAAADSAYTENLRADAVLTDSTGGFPLDFANTVRATPGVAAASALLPSAGYLESKAVEETGNREIVPLQGITADGADQTASVAVTAGNLSELRGNTVALTTTNASDFGYKLGDTITMWLGDDTEVSVRVVALFSARPGYESALLPADLLAPHTKTGLAQQILVRAAPGADQQQLTSALAGLAKAHPGLRVADRNALRTAHAEQEQTGVWVNYLLVGIIIGYTVISLVNTLVVATGERRREFALQRLVGATRGQVLRMMGVECVLVAVSGIVLGSVVALVTLIPFGLALNDSPAPHGPLWIYLVVIGSSALLTVLATFVPASYALRSRPIEAAAG